MNLITELALVRVDCALGYYSLAPVEILYYPSGQ